MGEPGWPAACTLLGVKRILMLIGAGALLAWTGLGVLAWQSVGQRVTVVTGEEAAQDDQGARILALEDELGSLHQDVRALANAMGENLAALQEGLLAGQEEQAVEVQRRLAALRDEVGSKLDSPSSKELADLRRELRELRDSLRVGTAPELAATPPAEELVPELEVVELEVSEAVPPAMEPAADPEPAAEAPRAKRSFLAFKLPSDDFRFDERRSWTVLPSLSRIGFDAKTTLHDFTATTSTLQGSLEADLSHPDQGPRALLHVEAASLVSGNTDRDEAMREHLAVTDHPAIDFELTAFEPDAIELDHKKASGTAAGRMTIRGVTQDVRMPVRITLDDSRRLCVEGEMPLDLERFEVPVPHKLGLISMDKVVKVWISLRLRVDPRSEG